MVDAVDALRSFNRSFTSRIGALDDSFLASGRPLGQARVLFEIGRADGVTARDLRRDLGLDSGYLSRLLRALEHDDLVETVPDPDDARRRLVRLTAAGRSAWADLDARSDERARALVSSLTGPQRDELAGALRNVERLLAAAGVRFDIVDPRSPAALESMGRYFEELDERFTGGFDPGDTLVADADAMRAPRGRFVVAFDGRTAVACGGVVRIDDTTAEIKRMWVDTSWRGLGLGRRMLAFLERQCTELGHRRVVLDTNSTLTTAITMYERAGFAPTERYNDNPYAQRWFAKELGAAPADLNR